MLRHSGSNGAADCKNGRMLRTSRPAVVSWGVEHSCCSTADEATQYNTRLHSLARDAVASSHLLYDRIDIAVPAQPSAYLFTNPPTSHGSLAPAHHSAVSDDHVVRHSQVYHSDWAELGRCSGEEQHAAVTREELPERSSASVFDQTHFTASQASTSDTDSSNIAAQDVDDGRYGLLSSTSSNRAADLLDARQSEAGCADDHEPLPAAPHTSYRVVSVTAVGNENVHQQPLAQLRFMWDADSVPYSVPVMSAVVKQLGNAQVQSVDVFATGATAAALCTASAGDTPAGGVLRIDVSGGVAAGSADATTSLSAHALQVAYAETAACTYVIVSSNPNAIPTLTALRTLGRAAAAVSASSDPSSPPDTVPMAQPCTVSIHLTLAPTSATAPHATAAPIGSEHMHEDSRVILQSGRREGADAPHAQHEQSREVQRLASMVSDPLVPPAMRQMLQQPLSKLCASLSGCLDRAAEFNVARLQERMQRHPAALCGAEDFPHEIVAVPSLRFALVAGFAAESTWLPCEKAAVLEMLLKADDWNLYAQIGCLAMAPEMDRLPPSKSTAARVISADGANSAAGRALIAHMLHRCRGFSLPPQLSETLGRLDGSPSSAGAGVNGAGSPYAEQSRWLLLAACLDRISINWFSVIRGHMLYEPEFWAGIENFPMALCACDNFRRQTIATVGSTAVAEVHKRAIAQALLLFGEPGLVAQIAYLAKNPQAKRLPESIKLSEHINSDWELRQEGSELLQSLAGA